MKKNIALKIRGLIENIITENGYILWDVEYKKEGTSYNLVVTIDKDGDIDIDDCVKVNDLINPLLDEEDPIEDSYCLEVSSAGLERDLKEDFQLEKYIGDMIDIRLFAPENGQKNFCALLKGFDKEKLILELDGEVRELERKKCALIKNYVDYAALMKEREEN